MVNPEALQIGRIVWAEVADQNGIRKQRPAIKCYFLGILRGIHERASTGGARLSVLG